MENNINNTSWETLRIIVHTPYQNSFLKELAEIPDIFVVFSKKSRLKIRLVEGGYK